MTKIFHDFTVMVDLLGLYYTLYYVIIHFIRLRREMLLLCNLAESCFRKYFFKFLQKDTILSHRVMVKFIYFLIYIITYVFTYLFSHPSIHSFIIKLFIFSPIHPSIHFLFIYLVTHKLIHLFLFYLDLIDLFSY